MLRRNFLKTWIVALLAWLWPGKSEAKVDVPPMPVTPCKAPEAPDKDHHIPSASLTWGEGDKPPESAIGLLVRDIHYVHPDRQPDLNDSKPFDFMVNMTGGFGTLIGPRAVMTKFYDQFSDPCKATINRLWLKLPIEIRDEYAIPVFIMLRIDNVVLISMGISVSAGDEPGYEFIIAQDVRFMGRMQPLRMWSIAERPQEGIKQRLEYLRNQLRAENISYEELHELQSLAAHIEPGDVELLEAAGVPEFPN